MIIEIVPRHYEALHAIVSQGRNALTALDFPCMTLEQGGTTPQLRPGSARIRWPRSTTRSALMPTAPGIR